MTSKEKQFGVVYTPALVVDLMLDKITTFKNVAICDPSCGDGQFLVTIAERICKKFQRCQSASIKDSYISTLKKLTGFDIDRAALKKCRKRLNKILQIYELKPIEWNLRQIDAIDKDNWLGFSGFDYVVGNPPYVRIQHLEDHRRNRIKKGDWHCMNGCSDLFILFFEMGLKLAKPKGKLIYITPSSWMKSNSGKALREFIQTKHTIKSITDFGDYQVFGDVTTYTAITEVQTHTSTKNQSPSGLKYTGTKEGVLQFGKRKVFLGNQGWQILSKFDANFMYSISASKIKLSDVADIRVGIQTLADDIFIFAENSLDVEPEITKRVFKASVMKNGVDKIDRRVIYPYDENGKLLPEETLEAKFKKAYSYLLRHKQRLLSRDKGNINPRKWYGYGREVSIHTCFGEKLLTSGMNPAPNFQRCPDPYALFYSGYCIKPKSEISLTVLLDELNSRNMEQYIRIVSRPFRNGWFSYAKSFIQNFPVSEKVYG